MKFTQILLMTLALTGIALAEDSPTVPIGGQSVPEIDGSSAVAAVALVAGSLTVLRSRRK